MSVSLVGETDSWGRGTPFALCVLDTGDGEYGQIWHRNRGAEIALHQKDAIDGKDLVISVVFRTKSQADRAGEILMKAFAQVRELCCEDTQCPHETFEFTRFSRSSPPIEICAECGHERVEAVV